MKKTLIFFTFLLLGFAAFAQPYTADFQADRTRGCAPLTITVTDLSGSEADPNTPQPLYEFAPGLGYTTNKTHTYTTPGLYTVSQIISTGGTPSTDTETKVNYIEVLQTPQPQIDVTFCENREITLYINDNVYEQYFVNFGDGTFQTLTGNSQTSHTYSSTAIRTITVQGNYNPGGCGGSNAIQFTPLDLLTKPAIISLQNLGNGQASLRFTALSNHIYVLKQINVTTGVTSDLGTVSKQSGEYEYIISNLSNTDNYCFFIQAQDACGATLNSEEICLLRADVVAADGQNNITLNTYPSATNFSRYVITRDGEPTFNQPLRLINNFFDHEIACGREYCYTATAELNHDGNIVTSTSTTTCVTSTSTAPPPPLSELNSTFENNVLKIRWDHADSQNEVSEYNVLRSVNQGSYTPLASLQEKEYTDNDIVIPANTYCYQVIYTDICQLSSGISPETCPVILSGRDRDNFNRLTWTAYSGTLTAGGINYVLEILNEGGDITESFPLGTTLAYDHEMTNPAQVVRYRIKVESLNDPTKISYSNTVELRFRAGVYLPNTFTPNNDGLNDLFVAKGRFIKTYNLTIFNKWGEVVFNSTDMNVGWDGTYKGNPPVPGSYVYTIEYEDYLGDRFDDKRTVTLIY